MDNINVTVKSKNPAVEPKNLKQLTLALLEANESIESIAHSEEANEQDITAIKEANGTFVQKPSGADIYVGFAYFCTDKQTTEGATNGIMIYYKGQDVTDPDNPVDVWVDALGRIIE